MDAQSYTAQERRAANQVWAAAGAYGFEPLFLARLLPPCRSCWATASSELNAYTSYKKQAALPCGALFVFCTQTGGTIVFDGQIWYTKATCV